MANQATRSILENEDGTISTFVDLQVYSAEAVKKAAYKFTDECAISLTLKDKDLLELRVEFKTDSVHEHKHNVVNAITNEILDQDLRELISKKTEQKRNVILAHAFSRTNLISNQTNDSRSQTIS